MTQQDTISKIGWGILRQCCVDKLLEDLDLSYILKGHSPYDNNS